MKVLTTRYVQQADAFKEKLYDASVAIDRRTSMSLGESGSTQTPATASPSSPAARKCQAQLPKLSLRKFDRDITSWMAF